MLLKNKNAVIYGAAGSLGGAISQAFAKAGATVYVTGHKLEPVRKLAAEIIAAGGKAVASEVDALDERAVKDNLDAIVSKAGTIDITFNAISIHALHGVPLIDMALEDFTRPVEIAMRTQFITSTAAARYMKKQGSGVILSLTATPAGIGYANVGGFGPACCAMESFSRDLASELGPYGIRVVNIRSGGSPDSRVFKEAIDQGSGAFLKEMENDTMLKKLPLMEDIANTAVFLVSAMAGKITGVTVDVTCGTTTALNYTVPRVE